MLKSDTSSPDFFGNRHTYARIRQLRADLESLARGCLIWPNANFLTRQTCARVRATNTGTVSCALTAAGVRQPNHLDRLPIRGFPTPSVARPRRRRPKSATTFKTRMSSRIFSASSRVRTPVQTHAQIGSPRGRDPCNPGRESSPATVLLAAALPSYRRCCLAAFGAGKPTAQRLANLQSPRELCMWEQMEEHS